MVIYSNLHANWSSGWVDSLHLNGVSGVRELFEFIEVLVIHSDRIVGGDGTKYKENLKEECCYSS